MTHPGLVDAVRSAAGDIRYDATAPVPAPPTWTDPDAAPSRQNQWARRAAILATIRRLIISEGCDGVTVRGIAEGSGFAIQTIYNLVGPRTTAITEAIREYSAHVGMPQFDPHNPIALADVVEHQVRAIEQNPEFCRAVCLMYFGSARGIYYAFRASQIKRLHALLRRQQKLGVLRAGADLQEIATQVMVYAGALCIEWADGAFPLAELRPRLYLGNANILSSAIGARGEALRLALASRCSGSLN